MAAATATTERTVTFQMPTVYGIVVRDRRGSLQVFCPQDNGRKDSKTWFRIIAENAFQIGNEVSPESSTMQGYSLDTINSISAVVLGKIEWPVVKGANNKAVFRSLSEKEKMRNLSVLIREANENYLLTRISAVTMGLNMQDLI